MRISFGAVFVARTTASTTTPCATTSRAVLLLLCPAVLCFVLVWSGLFWSVLVCVVCCCVLVSGTHTNGKIDTANARHAEQVCIQIQCRRMCVTECNGFLVHLVEQSAATLGRESAYNYTGERECIPCPRLPAPPKPHMYSRPYRWHQAIE